MEVPCGAGHRPQIGGGEQALQRPQTWHEQNLSLLVLVSIIRREEWLLAARWSGRQGWAYRLAKDRQRGRAISTAFVTGGSGFIGNALIRRLVADGHTVSALGRRDAPAPAVGHTGA